MITFLSDGMEVSQYSNNKNTVVERVSSAGRPRFSSCVCHCLLAISRSLLKIIAIESVMLSYHFILCHPLLLQPSIFPSIRVFSNESALRIRWSKYWSFSFSISPSNEYSGLISFKGFPGGPSGKEPACQCRRRKRCKFNLWVR